MMMRHLASVGETYAQTTLEDTAWNLWPINPSQASASGSTISPPGGRLPERTGSLHLRNASQSANDDVANILAMAETVREVLPHIPDDMIFQVCFGYLHYIMCQSFQNHFHSLEKFCLSI